MKNEALALSFLPAAWKTQPLAKVAAVFTDGNWIESKDQADSGIRLVQTGNVGIGQFKDRYEKARFIDEATFARLKCFEVLPGDLLISRLPDPVGRTCIIPDTGQKMITAVDCSIVRVRDTAIDPKFLVYYSQTQDYLRAVDALCSGTTRRRISRKNLGNVPVPLPPLDEQKRIVAVLDQAFAAVDRARAHAEGNVDSSHELFRRFLDATLSNDDPDWKPLPLKSLGTIQTGSTPKTSETENYGNFIPFITPSDFNPDGSIEIENRGLSEVGAEKARHTTAGSALMVCIGATIGKSGFTAVEITTNQQINSISPQCGISGEFLYYQFITPHFQREIAKRSGQATLPIINKSKWSEITVNVPPDLATQIQVVEKLREMRNHTEYLIAGYRKKLADITDLRQSLLQKAFAGELV